MDKKIPSGCRASTSAALVVLFACAFCYGFVRRTPGARPRVSRAPARFAPVSQDETAILIACHNGAATIAGIPGQAVAGRVRAALPRPAAAAPGTCAVDCGAARRSAPRRARGTRAPIRLKLE